MMDALMKRKANIRAIAYERMAKSMVFHQGNPDSCFMATTGSMRVTSLKSWMMEKDWKSRMMAVISIRGVIYTIVTTISEKRISGMLGLFRKKR